MIFKGEASDIQINILRRSNSETEDYWDGNWLETEVMIRVRGFNGLYRTNLRVDELQSFYNDAVTFLNREKSKIEFMTMEEGLYLQIESEMTGTINVSGKGMDDAFNSLNFRFESDLTAMENFIKEFARDLKLYPLVGSL